MLESPHINILRQSTTNPRHWTTFRSSRILEFSNSWQISALTRFQLDNLILLNVTWQSVYESDIHFKSDQFFQSNSLPNWNVRSKFNCFHTIRSSHIRLMILSVLTLIVYELFLIKDHQVRLVKWLCRPSIWRDIEDSDWRVGQFSWKSWRSKRRCEFPDWIDLESNPKSNSYDFMTEVDFMFWWRLFPGSSWNTGCWRFEIPVPGIGWETSRRRSFKISSLKLKD
jgi:hypothetical protein